MAPSHLTKARAEALLSLSISRYSDKGYDMRRVKMTVELSLSDHTHVVLAKGALTCDDLAREQPPANASIGETRQ